MSARIMVVDDEPDLRGLLAAFLAQEHYEVVEVEDGAGLRKALGGPPPNVVLLDLKLPDAEGQDLLVEIRKQWPLCEVIILTGYATIDAAVSAIKMGAYDFQKKPFDSKSLLVSVERAIEHQQLKEEAGLLRRAIASMSGTSAPIFQSAAMKTLIRTVERVAPSEVPVFISGESGTGKEVIADLLHALSPRSSGPLVKVICAALSKDQLDVEWCGSVAAPGRGPGRTGIFRQAEGGTLLLDGISDMPLEAQGILLHTLQEREYRPLGAPEPVRANFRIAALTNQPVEESLRGGKLREDLFYRINTVMLHIQPLRQRREDILPLANSFLKRYAAQANRNFLGFTPPAMEMLVRCDWPGNVRQLQNEVQRAVLMCDGPVIDTYDLSVGNPAQDSAPALREQPSLTLMQAMERSTIVQILEETRGNKLEAARRLGIGRQTLYNKIKLYRISS